MTMKYLVRRRLSGPIGRYNSILEITAIFAEVLLGFQQTRDFAKKEKRDKDLIDRAWKGIDDGTLAEFEIGDVRIVSASSAAEKSIEMLLEAERAAGKDEDDVDTDDD